MVKPPESLGIEALQLSSRISDLNSIVQACNRLKGRFLTDRNKKIWLRIYDGINQSWHLRKILEFGKERIIRIQKNVIVNSN